MHGPQYARVWPSRYPLLVPVLILHCLDIHGKTSLVAVYFSETSSICPVRVSNREIWRRHKSVNTSKFINYFIFKLCHVN